jgi:hypothetical protein
MSNNLASPEAHSMFEKFLAKVCGLEKSPTKSCWLIEFESGYKVILSEELYETGFERNWAGDRVLSEAHWHNIEECRKRNRGVLYVE